MCAAPVAECAISSEICVKCGWIKGYITKIAGAIEGFLVETMRLETKSENCAAEKMLEGYIRTLGQLCFDNRRFERKKKWNQ